MKKIVFLFLALVVFVGNNVAQEKVSKVQLYQQGKKMSSVGKHKEAFGYYQKAADLGYAEAEYQVGLYYYVGFEDIVQQSNSKAVEWLEKAAKQDCGIAQHKLGEIFLFGTGIDSFGVKIDANQEKAAEYFKKAIKNGRDSDYWYESAKGYLQTLNQ